MSPDKALRRVRAPISSTPTRYQVATGELNMLTSLDGSERQLRAATRALRWIQGCEDFREDPRAALSPTHHAYQWVCDQREAWHRNSLADWQVQMLKQSGFFGKAGNVGATVAPAAQPLPKLKCKPNTRMAEVMERAVHALLFPVQRTSIGACKVGERFIQGFFARAWFYEQGVRVRTADQGGWSKPWWLRAISDIQLPEGYGMSIQAGRRRDDSAWDLSAGMETLRLDGLTVIESQGYVADGGEMQVTLASPDGLRVRMDYDVSLADQTHRGANFMDILRAWNSPNEVPPMINWRMWEAGPPVPKLASTKTTANVAFERSFQQLRIWVKEQRGDNPEVIPYVSWAKDRAHYKFIEHMVLKCRLGGVPPSHLERLYNLDFVWGSDRDHISDLIALELRTPTGCKPFRSAALYEHRGSANESYQMAA